MSAFDKIIGYEEIKGELIRVCDILKNPQKYADLGVKTPKGLIFYGDPGTGKTLMSKCLMEESGRSQFICRKDKSDGEFMKAMRKTFEDAKKAAPSIILLDDMDKFANDEKFTENGEEYVAVQACMDDFKDDDIFVVATCNQPRYLPGSLVRAGRFDIKLEIENPKGEEAEKIVEYYLQNKKCASDVDAKEIAVMLAGESCARLESVVNQGGLLAGFSGKKEIEMEDMVEAILELLYNAPKSLKKNSKKETMMFAVHEAGHAVVSEILSPNSVHLISIRKHIGEVGGFTFVNKDEDYNIDIEKRVKQVMHCLGGRAATELVFGQVDIGASNDLEIATRILSRLAKSYGAFGFNKLTNPYFDTESDEHNERIINAVATEMDRLYDEVKNIIAKNMDFLKKITDGLVKKETLTATDIKNIKKTCKICK